MFCRDLTADYDEVRVISGPLFLPEEDKDSGKSFVKYEVSLVGNSSSNQLDLTTEDLELIHFCSLLQVIGKNHVAVPTHLYKVVLAESGSRPTAMGMASLQWGITGTDGNNKYSAVPIS